MQVPNRPVIEVALEINNYDFTSNRQVHSKCSYECVEDLKDKLQVHVCPLSSFL